MPDEVTNGEIVRRLDSLHADVRTMSGSFVRTELYESQRQDTGRRIGEIEHDVGDVRSESKAATEKLRTDFESYKTETDRRFRNNVSMFIAGAISLGGGAILLVVQLVFK